MFINPFDKSFFRFFFGFIAILLLSFALLYVVGEWGDSIDSQAAALMR
jgi:hypothetical protein